VKTLAIQFGVTVAATVISLLIVDAVRARRAALLAAKAPVAPGASSV
jgi:hypothetical protein